MRSLPPSLAGAVITCKTVSRSGTGRTSSTGAALVCFQGPVKLVGVLTGYTAGGPVVVYLEVCNHEVMSPVMQAAGWRIVLTRYGSTCVDLRIFWGTTSNPL